MPLQYGLGEKRVNSNTKNLTYNETEVYWKKYQRFFPEELRINEKIYQKKNGGIRTIIISIWIECPFQVRKFKLF